MSLVPYKNEHFSQRSSDENTFEMVENLDVFESCAVGEIPLSLDLDFESYLDLRIPPVRIRNLCSLLDPHVVLVVLDPLDLFHVLGRSIRRRRLVVAETEATLH